MSGTHILPPLRFPTPWVEKLRSYLQDQQYALAYSFPMHDCTPLSLVDAGLTWRNMGDIHGERQRWDQALPCWSQAQQLLQEANVQIQSLKTTTPPTESASTTISVEQLLVETAQRIANVDHDSIEIAIQAHDNVVMVLVNLEDEYKTVKWIGSVRIVPFSRTDHDRYMGNTLSTLGMLHRQLGDTASALEALEEALELTEGTPQAPGILENLAELYLEQGDIDRAMDTLVVAVDCTLSNPNVSPSLESLKVMDQIGLAQEQWGKLDQALECYEKTLMARSNVLGSEHVDVAQSLLNVGRILESQGNVAGSLDLYKAAQKIYTNQLTSEGFCVEASDVQTILRQLVPSLMEQSRFEEAIAYLYKCVECEDIHLDKSTIYYSLGKAHCGMHDYVSATVCLVEAGKHPGGSVSNEQVLALLGEVERMQRENDDDEIEKMFDSESESSKSNSSSLSSHEEAPVGNSSLEILKELLGADQAVVLENLSGEQQKSRSTEIAESGIEVTLSTKRSTTPTMDLKATKSRCSNTPVTDEMVNSNQSADGDDARVDEVISQAETSESQSEPPKQAIVDDDRDDVEQIKSSSHSPLTNASKEKSPGKTDLTIRTVTITSASEKMEDHAEEQENVIASPTPVPPPPPPPPPAYKQSRRFGFSPRKKDKGGSSRSKKFWKQKNSLGSPSSSRSKNETQEASTPREEDRDLDVLALEQEYHTSFDGTFNGPIPYVSVENSSWDDASQITMNFDFSVKQSRGRGQGQEWWFGVSAERFGKWFPAAYVSQAVQAAEGFLSAKSIHAKMRSDPLVMEVEEDATIGYQNGQETRTLSNDGSLIAASSSKLSDNNVDDQAIQATPKNEPRQEVRRRSLKSEIEACERRLAEQRSTLDSLDPQLGDTLMQLAVLQKSSRQFPQAIESATEALELQKACDNVKDAAESNHLLGELYLDQNQPREALARHTEALRMETNLYGRYSEEAAKALNYIGIVRSAQDDFKVAMKCHKEALTILKECRGEDPRDPVVSQTLCLIGSVYYRERNSLATIKEDSDEGFSTFIEGGLLETIGRAHEDRGSYKMAISFFEEKLQFLENRRGDFKDPEQELSTTLNSLGMLSSRAGLYNEALSYYAQALSLQTQVGCSPVQLATARVLQAAVRYHLGYWEESLSRLNESLEVLRNELGDHHETVAATQYQIGLIHASFCDYGEAMKALHSASVTQSSLLGDAHPATLRTKREIGNLYAVYEAELDTAFEYFWTVLESQRKVHGNKHPNIAETLHSLGIGFGRKGDTSNALRMLQECYYMRLEFLGVDHPLQALTLHAIARIHLKRNRVKKAMQICNVVLSIQQDSLSGDHAEIARTLTTKGQCLGVIGDTTGALQCLENEALPLATRAVGRDHPLTADIELQIGGIHLRMCQFKEARVHIQVAEELYTRADVDSDHPGLREVSEQLDRVQRDEMLCV